MKVLFVNRFYAPDLAGTALMLTELAEDLSKDGFRASILTSDAAGYDVTVRYPRREAIGGGLCSPGAGGAVRPSAPDLWRAEW